MHERSTVGAPCTTFTDASNSPRWIDFEIAELSRNLSKINSRQPSLKRAKTETVNAQKSLAKSASLRSAPSLERKPTFKIDEETEAAAARR